MTAPQTRRWGSAADPAGAATPVNPPRPGLTTTPHTGSGRPTGHGDAAGLPATNPPPHHEGRPGHDHARKHLDVDQSYPVAAEAQRALVGQLRSLTVDQLSAVLVASGLRPDPSLTTTTGSASALQPETPHATGP